MMPIDHPFREHKHQLFDWAKNLYKPASVLADIGCGIRPQSLFKARKTIYVEPWHEYADWLETHGFVPLVRKTALEFLKEVDPTLLDCIVLLDVIEHMNKDEGLEVLKLSTFLAHQVFVFTPLGFHENNDGDAWGLNGIEVQKHRSGWTPEDFKDWRVSTTDSSLMAVFG